jgi:hypothetical protein
MPSSIAARFTSAVASEWSEPVTDQLTRLDHSGWIDTSAWGIYPKWAREMVQDVIGDQLKNEPPRSFLPIQYAIYGQGDGLNGPPVSNPLTVYVSLPFGANEEEPVYMATSVDRMVGDMIEAYRCGTGFIEGEQEARVFTKVAASLRDLALKIESLIAPTPTPRGPSEPLSGDAGDA